MNKAEYLVAQLRIELSGYNIDTSVLDGLLDGYYPLDNEDLRFMSFVQVTSSCWNWQGTKNNGYGRFTLNGKQMQAHHYLWSIIHGKPIKGMHLDHLCKNKACVNPYHLELVTPKENSRRAKIKYYCAKGHWKGFDGGDCKECNKLAEIKRRDKQKELIPNRPSSIAHKLKHKRISYTTARAKGLI